HALGEIVSVLSFPIIALSATAAFIQIRAQAKNSRNQAALNALLVFYNKYTEVRKYRVRMIGRFKRGDKTLGYDDVLHYFSAYWSYRELEWKYFERGLLGADSLLEWAENALRHLDGKRDLNYYEGEEVRTLGSRERFENYALTSILRLSSSRKFYESLLDL